MLPSIGTRPVSTLMALRGMSQLFPHQHTPLANSDLANPIGENMYSQGSYLLHLFYYEGGEHFLSFKVKGFPSGSVVKNPPANAGDMGSIPGPGRSCMPQSS